MRPTYIKFKPKRKPIKIKRKTATTKSIKSIVNDAVKKTLMKKSDTKNAVTELNGLNFNSTISGLSDLIEVIPSITQGTDDNDRIGNSIIPTYTKITGYCTAAFDANFPTALGPLDVQMFILRNKNQRDSNSRSVFTDLNIIKRGIAKFQFDGTFASTCSPINTEDFQVLMKRSFKLTPIPFGSSTVQSISMILPNNPNNGGQVYKFSHTIDWAKCGVTKFIYDAATTQFPNNENIFFCLGYAQYNAPEIPTGSTVTPVRVAYTAITHYKDF